MIESFDFAGIKNIHSLFSSLADSAGHFVPSFDRLSDGHGHFRSYLDGLADFVQDRILGEEDMGGMETGEADTGGDGSETGGGGRESGGRPQMDEEQKQRLAEYAKSMEGVVEKKTETISTMYMMLGAPIVLLIVVYLINLAYNFFTKTVDTVGKGVGSATSKLKKTLVEKVVENENGGEGEDAPKAGSKTSRRRLLFGEIVMRFVNPVVTEPDVNSAIAHQKESRQVKKIGEIMVEMGHITPKQVEQALKIQDKSAPK